MNEAAKACLSDPRTCLPISLFQQSYNDRVWPAPEWAQRLSKDVALFAGKPYNKSGPPLVLFIEPPSKEVFGGRWIYGKGIVMFEHDDKAINFTVLLHELSHWIEGYGPNKNRKGFHDQDFYDTVRSIYAEFRAPTRGINNVERNAIKEGRFLKKGLL
jgi:hypothetical protein